MPRSIVEIRKSGWEALIEHLGIADATLFILEYETGYGDYTEERRRIFAEKKLDDIVKEIKDIKSRERDKHNINK